MKIVGKNYVATLLTEKQIEDINIEVDNFDIFVKSIFFSGEFYNRGGVKVGTYMSRVGISFAPFIKMDNGEVFYMDYSDEVHDTDECIKDLVDTYLCINLKDSAEDYYFKFIEFGREE